MPCTGEAGTWRRICAARASTRSTIGGYLLLLWWRPTPQFGYWVNIIIFFVLLMLGTEVAAAAAGTRASGACPAVSTPAA